MKLFKWSLGRQSTAIYHKYCFLYWKIGKYGFDGYILRYPPNTDLPVHKDPVNGSHYRINVKLKGKASFWCTSVIKKWGERIIIFRPDLYYHSLKTFTKTYKLSLGFVRFNLK